MKKSFFSLFFLLIPMVLPSLEMTLGEKVGQCLMVHCRGEAVNEEFRALVQDLHVGGIIYFTWANGLHSPTQVLQLSSQLQDLASIPLLIAADQEGGRVVRLSEGFRSFQAIKPWLEPKIHLS